MDYGIGKRGLEDALAAAWAGRRFPATRLRIPMVSGERDHFRRIERYLSRMLDGGPLLLPGGGAHETRHVYSGSVVRAILDLLGNMVQNGKGQRFTPRQEQPLEYVIGKKWTTRFGVSKGEDDQRTTEFEFRVAARERITVPAGTFDCYRIEGTGTNRRAGRESTDISVTVWRAPDRVRTFVAKDETKRGVVRGHVTTVSGCEAGGRR